MDIQCYICCTPPAGHPQDHAGKTFHFVERPPGGLMCAVCHELAHDPVQANCCGKIYCLRCIERWKTRSNSCPTCRSTKQSDPPFSTFSDKRAYQDIQSLFVYCPNMCDKKMELYEVEDHLASDSGCPLHVVDCSNKCRDGVCRSYITEHLTSTCRLRKVKCIFCPLESTYEDVWEKHIVKCPNYPLDCPNDCGECNVTRSTVSAHREVCPLERVECGYKRFGCAIVLPRVDMAEHLKTSIDSHLQMTPMRVEAQEVRLQEQEVHLEKEKINRMVLEAQLEVVKATAKKEKKTMNEAIALMKKQMEDSAQEQETLLKQERAERQLIEVRLQEVEEKLASLLAKQN